MNHLTPEHCICIARVSKGKQRSEDQRPELTAYAERKGYTLDALVTVQGHSAFTGKQVKHIKAAVDQHVKNGDACVVVFRHVDRSSRQGTFEGHKLISYIHDAGARVEFSSQEFLNDQPGLLGMFFEMAKQESKIKQDRSIQGHAVKRAKGEVIGKIPWGYDKVLDSRGVQVGMVPSTLGREWIPRIFHAAINGSSLQTIAEMLQGIPTASGNKVWNVTGVRQLLIRTTYYGHMPSNPNLEYEPLITVEEFKAANAAMQARRDNGRGTVKHEAPLVRPVCGECLGVVRDGCPSGRSPMYVHRSKSFAYMRCMGHGPGRKSCGTPLVRVDALYDAVEHIMANDSRPHMTMQYFRGSDNSEAHEILLERMSAAQQSGDWLQVAQIAQEIAALGPVERKASAQYVPSGKTVGERWATLSPVEKRDEMGRWEVIVYRDRIQVFGKWHDEPGRTVIGDMIEGREV